MLDALITSKTRIRLITKFFLNPGVSSYLRELASEFGESTNSVKIELDRLSNAGLLKKTTEGRVVKYAANKNHPMFLELASLVRKYFGIDKIVEDILNRLGDVKAAYITGDYAKGIDSGIIDLVIVGNVNWGYLQDLVEKAENLIKRKIRVLLIKEDELRVYKNKLSLEESILLVGEE
ncbi:hypothetical protein SAMN04488516_102359 [Desulfonauticus submarinus]|uniref:ArsR family transcriptional regulator n=1 Tax=Desulfonauticus submarinus TaxID=206665 RepID=A0A1H0C0P8_9BACT|nr:transcriptional regulator [Desulfonauticus submarinus]SDN51390.1 hypothetical protein SAMN04488516_102359 [Desulfonauticus submarinus]